ncbi:MAG: iron ABC transporter substrate-binding protein, partial [Micrococcales bacterium]|nr:iron ABC transporter substrate-binding protein [Micrococcales bacterium]
MKKTLSYIVAGALALSLTACSNPLDEDKNSITVYAGRSESLVQPLIDSFQEETG